VRVRVRFRYNAATGEVEAFDVDDMHEGPRLADHDARHDAAAADVARIVEANALIEEVAPGTAPATTVTTRIPDQATEPGRGTDAARE
jgi:hypothetical protein